MNNWFETLCRSNFDIAKELFIKDEIVFGIYETEKYYIPSMNKKCLLVFFEY